MASRWLALSAAVLLAVGFGGGFLAGSHRADDSADEDLILRDGPILHLENRSEKNGYLIAMEPKSGIDRPRVVVKGRAVEISKEDFRRLELYRISRAIDPNRLIRPCMTAACTVSPSPPPPSPPSLKINILPARDINWGLLQPVMVVPLEQVPQR